MLSGESVNTPIESTILDLAFSLYKEKGYQYAGAIVNGETVKVDYLLKDGDIVKLIKQSHITSPSPTWKFGKEFNKPSTKYLIKKDT